MAYSNEEYLIELLLEAGLIDDRAVQTARGTKKPNESLIDTLIKTGVISDEQVAQNVAAGVAGLIIWPLWIRRITRKEAAHFAKLQ